MTHAAASPAAAPAPSDAAREPASPVRTIGLIGGTSPQSTLEYYRALINLSIANLRRDEYPRIVLVSMNLRQCMAWMAERRWDLLGAALLAEIETLKAAGCEFAAICSNTTHRGLEGVGPPALPLVNIMDVVASEAKRRGMRTLALTGTGFLMRDGFYARGLRQRGLDVLLPTEDEQAEIHRIIFDELLVGVVRPASVAAYAAITHRMLRSGADALLLGCTELAMPAAHADWPEGIPLIDSAQVHAAAIFEAAVRPVPLV